MARDERTVLLEGPSFASERKSWKDKRCPLNDHCNIKGGLTITKARAQNNGEIFREHKEKEQIGQKDLWVILLEKKKKKKKKQIKQKIEW